MSVEILVEGTVLACVASGSTVAVGTVTVSPGSSTNVFSTTLPALLASDIENASGTPNSVTYSIPSSQAPGSGHFESFVISTGATTKFYDASNELYLITAGGTCTFKVDTPSTITNPAAPPPTIADPTTSYPATWTVQSSGQSPVYLLASP